MKYIGQFFQDIGQFFQEDDTQRFSAIRLILLAWALGTLATWSLISFDKKDMKDMPQSVQIVLLTLITGKVVQKFGEKSSTTDSDEQQPDEQSAEAIDPCLESGMQEQPAPELAPKPTNENGKSMKPGDHLVSSEENATPAAA